MAKMFYNTEEVQEKLGCSADEIKDLVQQGRLREFRDGAKIMFRVSEVDKLVSSSPEDNQDQSGEIGLVPTAAALANALRQYDGIRRYTLPMKRK